MNETRKPKFDPQIIVKGKLIPGARADVIVFSLPSFGLVQEGF